MSDRKDPESIVREIKRKTRRKYSSEEKIGIVQMAVVAANAGRVG